jgi:pre-rRNA-processing protein TSR3
MNTAEAMAACLYIAGFKDYALYILDSFSYGSEFIKLNEEALEAYSQCASSFDVEVVQNNFILAEQMRINLKTQRKYDEGLNSQSYLHEDDLPPFGDDIYEYEETNDGHVGDETVMEDHSKNDDHIDVNSNGKLSLR